MSDFERKQWAKIIKNANERQNEMKLQKIGGSKRGPKRIALARKIAAEGRKNWHARASMICDGIGAKKPAGDLPCVETVHSEDWRTCTWCRQ